MTFSVFSRCYFVELRVIFVALRYVPFRASNSYHKADIFLHKVLVESVEFVFFLLKYASRFCCFETNAQLTVKNVKRPNKKNKETNVVLESY